MAAAAWRVVTISSGHGGNKHRDHDVNGGINVISAKNGGINGGGGMKT